MGKTKMGVNECATCNAAGDMEVASVTNGADLRKHVRRRDPLAWLLPLSERLHYILFLRRKNASILPQSCAVQEIEFCKISKRFPAHLVMSISAQAAIDLGKEILEGAGGRGQSIPDVIELILKEAFQIVCIFLLNKGIAGVG